MADRFFVGDTDSDWNDADNWASSTGGAGGAGVPGTSDTAIFDANSPACTVDVGFDPSILDLDILSYASTLDINDNDITIANIFTMDAGTVTMGNGTWLFTKNTNATIIAVSGGTQTQEGSLVKLKNTSGNFTLTLDTGGMTFNDFEVDISSTNGKFAVTGLAVAGNMTWTSLDRFSSGTISLDGDFISTATTAGNIGKVDLVGSSTQEIYVDKAGGTGYFPNIEIANGAAATNLYDNITLNHGAAATILAKTSGGTVTAGTSKIIVKSTSNFNTTINDTSTDYNDITIDLDENNGDLIVTGTLKVDGDFELFGGDTWISGQVDVKGDLICSSPKIRANGLVKMVNTSPSKIKVDEAGGTGFMPRIEIASSSTVSLFDNLKNQITSSATSWLYTSGTVVEGSSKVFFDINANATLTVDGGAEAFNDIEFTSSNNNGKYAVTGTLNVTGEITYGQFSQFNSGTVSCTGDVTSTNSNGSAMNHLLQLAGTGDQTVQVDGALGSGFFPTIELVSTGGTVTFNDNIRIRTNATATGFLYTSGTAAFGTDQKFIADMNANAVQTWNTGALVINDLEINNQGTNGKFAATGTVIVGGDFTVTKHDGGGSGTVEVRGNATTADASTGGVAVTLTGTAIQDVDTTAGVGNFWGGTFTINKTGGFARLTSGSELDLDGAGQDMTITAGSFFCTNGNDLTINDVLTIDGTLQIISGDTVTAGTQSGSTTTVGACSGPVVAGGTFSITGGVTDGITDGVTGGITARNTV